MGIQIGGLVPLLSVFDMPASIEFYCGELGFTVVGTDGNAAIQAGWVMLELNGSQLMLNTMYDHDERPPKPDQARIAAHEDTAMYFDCPDVDEAYRSLTKIGLRPEPPKIAHYGMKRIYLTDPDGYLLCFQWKVDDET